MKNQKTKKSTYMDKLITNKNPKSPVSEAFRTVRTNIEFSDIDKNVKTILITSAAPNEGKSTVTANLAVSMALSGKRILIIDADLRNPTLHKFYDVSNNIGLTNLLVDETIEPEDVLLTPHKDLYFLPSGPLPPNPAELLGSHKMQDLYNTLTQAFDIILVDAPPVLAVADASILASYLDGVILVASAGEVSKDQINSAKEQLQKVKANILGVVLNKVPVGNGSYYYQYYYGTKN
jgi:capsular exopolysaccharide synthesis family protein